MVLKQTDSHDDNKCISLPNANYAWGCGQEVLRVCLERDKRDFIVLTSAVRP